MVAIEPLSTRRETSKAERRQRIVEAAEALVRKNGFDKVSMTQIADQAGVAPATLYNLFETKRAIFRQVFDLDLEKYEQLVAELPARGAINKIFASIDLAASLYRRNPEFYRAMARGGGADTGGLRSDVSEPRIAFWHVQIAAAVAQGQLRSNTKSQIVAVALSQQMRGAFLEWAARVISPERMAKETAYSFAMTLLAHASEKSAPSLKTRLKRIEIMLMASGRK